jgi:hypothetical protein
MASLASPWLCGVGWLSPPVGLLACVASEPTNKAGEDTSEVNEPTNEAAEDTNEVGEPTNEAGEDTNEAG